MPGRVYRTAVGRLFVEAVDASIPARLSARDVRAAGYATRAEEAVAELRGTEDLPTYRIRFHALHEADPRDVLAASEVLGDDEVAELDERLADSMRQQPRTVDARRPRRDRGASAVRAADSRRSSGARRSRSSSTSAS